MKKALVILLIGLVTTFVGCDSYDEVKKYEDVGIIQETYSRWVGVAGKGGHRNYYTIVKYKNVEYKISGSKTKKWAEDKIGKEVNLNVDEYIKNGEVIDIDVDIDEYSN